MKEIEDILISYLDAAPMTVLGTRLANAVEADIDDPFIKINITLVRSDIQNVEAALNRTSDSEYTKLIFNKDKKRDDCFISFKDAIRPFLRKDNPEIVEAAEYLVKIIEKHGTTLYSLGYVEQTSVMKLLFTDLQTGKAKGAMQKLPGLQSWYDDMVQAEKDFEDTYVDKTEDTSDKSILPLKQSLPVLSRHLIALVENIKIINDNAPGSCDALIDQMNIIISEIMTTAKANKTRKANKPDDADSEV